MELLLAVVVIAGGLFALRRATGSPARTARPHPADGASPTGRPGAEASIDLAELTERLKEHRQVAYLPVAEPGDGAPTASKFSGVPYLAPGEAWPRCANCGQAMQMFVQLAGDALPPDARERIAPGELLQFFYCMNVDPCCEADCEAYLPHAKSTLLRIVTPAEGAHTGADMPAGMFAPARIVGWTAVDDYPNHEELGDAEVAISDAEFDALVDDFPRSGEKLLGWPLWVQSVEYPDCRVCGSRMELLFQIDSEDNLPYMWGDVGVGHITQCREHRGELAFGWACH
jgi:hypothetical protein